MNNGTVVKQRKRVFHSKRFKTQLSFWIMLIIPLAFFILIKYWPMFGIAIAFQDYKLGDPFLSVSSRWVGIKWFKQLFRNPNLGRLIGNTLWLSMLSLLIAYPISICFALLLNELTNEKFRSFAANVSLLPHFISTVVIVAIMFNIFSVNGGLINQIIQKFGGEQINFMIESKWFRPLYVGSGIWAATGFDAVVFTAAISGIDPNLYEAAAIDGSNRMKNILHITIPCILPTIIMMFLLRVGKIMTIGYEKIMLMYSPAIYDVSDVLSTYSYRAGLVNNKQSLSTAISLLNAVCNITILVIANRITKKVADSSLW